MKRFVVLCILLLVVTTLNGGAVYAADDASFSKQELYDVQKKVIDQLALEDEKYESGFYLAEDGLYVVEEREVIFDYSNDLKVIEQSMTKPTAIRKVSTTMTLAPLETEINSPIPRALTYENKYTTDTTEYTYDGNVTTFIAEMKYRFIEDWYVDFQKFDAYSLQEINFSFDSDGYGHIINIYGEHHQRGNDLDNNWQVVYNGSVYSSDRTDKDFSMYTQSGSADWSVSNSEYCLITSEGDGGTIGSNYEIRFLWEIGGGQYDTVTRTDSISKGSLPN